MQQFNSGNQQLEQWITMERYRLQCAENWPDSAYKRAVLTAIQTKLQSLTTASLALVEAQQCSVCVARRAKSVLLEFPSRPQTSPSVVRLVA